MPPVSIAAGRGDRAPSNGALPVATMELMVQACLRQGGDGVGVRPAHRQWVPLTPPRARPRTGDHDDQEPHLQRQVHAGEGRELDHVGEAVGHVGKDVQVVVAGSSGHEPCGRRPGQEFLQGYAARAHQQGHCRRVGLHKALHSVQRA